MHFACYDCLFHWLKQGRMFCPFCADDIKEKPIRNEGFEIALAHAIRHNVVDKNPAQLGKKVAGKHRRHLPPLMDP
jgi:uncharacterized Zn finger protein (UPF0148 family)